MKQLFILLILIALINNAESQSKACKASCQLDPIIEVEEKIYYIFTGSDTTGMHVKPTLITLSTPRSEKVLKRKSDDCLEVNPVDCLIEVWEEVPALTMHAYTISDPTATTEYDVRKVKLEKIVRKGGPIEMDVLCQEKINKSLVRKIQNNLIKSGHLANTVKPSGILNEETKAALTLYQKDHQLAYGALTLETIDYMASN